MTYDKEGREKAKISYEERLKYASKASGKLSKSLNVRVPIFEYDPNVNYGKYKEQKSKLKNIKDIRNLNCGAKFIKKLI